jgi:hypothetical protein
MLIIHRARKMVMLMAPRAGSVERSRPLGAFDNARGRQWRPHVLGPRDGRRLAATAVWLATGGATTGSRGRRPTPNARVQTSSGIPGRTRHRCRPPPGPGLWSNIRPSSRLSLCARVDWRRRSGRGRRQVEVCWAKHDRVDAAAMMASRLPGSGRRVFCRGPALGQNSWEDGRRETEKQQNSRSAKVDANRESKTVPVGRRVGERCHGAVLTEGGMMMMMEERPKRERGCKGLKLRIQANV